VPHPRLIAACDDPSVLGAGFYLMEPVEGFNPTTGLAAPHLASAAMRHRMGLSMVEALRALRAVDHVKAGLSDLGKPDGYLERQVPRWLGQLESYRDFAGWPGPQAIAYLDEVAAWLIAHQPAGFTPGIMHGDFHLANVMFRNDGPELAAIVDWELVTIGDPMLDLGWLIATWPGDDGKGAGTIEVHPWSGFATTGQLLAHHAALGGGLSPDIAWYVVLAWFKLGILMEGTYARAFAGKAPRDTGETLHASTLELFRKAHAAINGDTGWRR
jgi:aminoglycoside phosphotransferase (APT) family kinase protein